ncbi:RagB/SusD family nutrient uptake outer membrane protein [Flavobacterium psychrotrophum]|uniref:RagB/SusD family nutrient uptake outer membrane protein n=1 Tax=Flavobacterium psychrotrophum TaxID=2294119 RepID=UPI000E3140BC|nr:RagB/SusD family nutrient uptake outer membrane protein [Flavobacterium psychrotrophum]
MRIFVKTLLIILVLQSMVSCSKDFLDQTVTTDLDEATVFADSTYTTAFLSDIYTQIGFASAPDRFSAGFVRAGGLQTAGDEAEPLVLPSVTADLQFVTGTVNSVTIDNRAWAVPYAYIRKVNVFLKHLPTTPLSNARKQSFGGEARFLRAWYYAALLQHYGGVPLVGDAIYNATERIPAERATYEEVVNYIVSECDAAAAMLTMKPSGRQYGRAGAGACKALKARVLLYAASPLFNGSDFGEPYNSLLGYPTENQDRWRIAMEAAQDVINTGAYQMYLDNTREPGYGWYAQFNANAGGVASNVAAATGGTILEFQAGGGAQLEQLFNPPSRGSVGPGGFPYQQTIDAFQMANGKDITDPTSGYNPANPYQNRDPRFKNSIIHDQALLPAGNALSTPVDIYLGSYEGQPAGQDAVHSGTTTGYYINKFRNRDISGTDGITTSQERPLIRYSEILLSFAEARNEFMGPDTDVYNAIESVRQVAGLNPYKLPTGLSKEAMREVIRHERQVELMFESHRFWDVRRWMIAPTTESQLMKGKEVNRNGSSVNFTDFNVRQHIWRDAQYFWPIPYSEISKSPELIQNPSY